MALDSGAYATRLASLTAAVVVAGAALALLAWFGANRVQARLATVVNGQAAREDRIPLWSRLLPAVAEYPILGSGYGTFDYVEPLTRTTGEDAGYRYEHAHNDYLEALLEGGVVRLGLSLLAVGLVFWLGGRAFLRGGAGPGGAWRWAACSASLPSSSTASSISACTSRQSRC